MIVTTADLSNISYQALGLVSGNVAYCTHFGRDIMAGFKNLAGGEIESYTQMLMDARNIAEQRMIASAQQLGADGIVAMRFANDTVAQGTIEVVAYGTAVKFV